ncbi:MAG: helix-hairpin-helix domain-containing protein [Marinisporobacter sp.]|jgi:competence protein ComEA|nr:helix-hairpin-helix domain-containing protein [Marinisporobacter sp.]
MFKLTKREIVVLGIFIFTIIVFSADKFYMNTSEELIVEHKNKEIENIEKSQEKKDKILEKFIIVDICGEVKVPGVVKLKEGSRLIDGVQTVGGLLKTADRKQVNMAKILVDGEQIIIPKIGEDLEECIDTQQVYGRTKTSNSVNINTASKNELELLNGVGEVLAERIIQYREKKGRFNKVEDIMNVSGVGDKKYEMIKEQIRIN